ncbi:urea transporter [Neobacillus sp. FSL H8-0543]|uniref:urea transporter n=1 Tax=Neobacillus sp. FSL H8-0543 TaxID=2954672 RepID=UPI0031597E6C
MYGNRQTKSLSGGKFFSIIVESLKGISQVIFIENAITGLLLLIAITISSYYIGIISLLSAIIGTLVKKIGGTDDNSIGKGLLGYNSVLTGMALALFLSGPYMWMIALVGSAVAAIFTAAMMHIMKRTGIPILTFPFIILTWFILLASYKLTEIRLNTKLLPHNLTDWKLNIAGEIELIDGIFNGFGQVFFLDNTLSEIIIVIAVFWAGKRLGVYALIGNVVAISIAYLLGGEHSLIALGTYGYNAILTIIAVSVVFKTEHNRFAFFSGIIAACLTVPITAGLGTFLLPYGLPVLTFPFVLCSWLVLSARKVTPNL